MKSSLLAQLCALESSLYPSDTTTLTDLPSTQAAEGLPRSCPVRDILSWQLARLTALNLQHRARMEAASSPGRLGEHRETLQSVAAQHQTTVEKLRYYNPHLQHLSAADVLPLNTLLKVPPPPVRASSHPSPAVLQQPQPRRKVGNALSEEGEDEEERERLSRTAPPPVAASSDWAEPALHRATMPESADDDDGEEVLISPISISPTLSSPQSAQKLQRQQEDYDLLMAAVAAAAETSPTHRRLLEEYPEEAWQRSPPGSGGAHREPSWPSSLSSSALRTPPQQKQTHHHHQQQQHHDATDRSSPERWEMWVDEQSEPTTTAATVEGGALFERPSRSSRRVQAATLPTHTHHGDESTDHVVHRTLRERLSSDVNERPQKLGTEGDVVAPERASILRVHHI